jgi:hypothetical protein
MFLLTSVNKEWGFIDSNFSAIFDYKELKLNSVHSKHIINAYALPDQHKIRRPLHIVFCSHPTSGFSPSKLHTRPGDEEQRELSVHHLHELLQNNQILELRNSNESMTP